MASADQLLKEIQSESLQKVYLIALLPLNVAYPVPVACLSAGARQ